MSAKKIKVPDDKLLKKDYEILLPQYEKVLYDLQLMITKDIKQLVVNPSIKGRIKSYESYYKKLIKRLMEFDNRDIAYSIRDILGLRITCPFQENLNVIDTFIKEKYEVIETEDKAVSLSFNEFGYTALHCLISVPQEILDHHNIDIEVVCEIQLCTILQDAWAEVEHELFYKTEFNPLDEPLKRKLAALNANLTLSDILFQEILDYQKSLQVQVKKRKESFFKKIEDNVVPYDKNLLPVNIPTTREKKNKKKGKTRETIDDSIKHNIDKLLIDGLEAHNEDNFSKAISIYTEIISYKIPDTIKVILYIHRGMAFFAESEYTSSIHDFSSALELESDNIKALFYRGIVNKVIHNYQRALEDITECIKLNPYNFNAYHTRAQIYFDMNNYSRALKDCRSAHKIESNSQEVKSLMEMIKSAKKLHDAMADDQQ